MSGVVLRKLLYTTALVAVATLIGYLLAATQLNPRARYDGMGERPPEHSIDSILTALNSNDKTPVVERLGVWASGVFRGDLGQSVAFTPVSDELGRRMWVSLRLMLLGAILGCAVGVLGGAHSATRQYGAVDIGLGLFSFVILSTPVVVLALLYQAFGTILNNALGFTGQTKLVYTIGEYTPGIDFWSWSGVLDRISHLVLPTLVLASVGVAIYSRYQRSTMLDVIRSDFLRTARAKGLRRSQAFLKHGLRTAIIPLVTYFSYHFVLLFVGATFTETVFGWYGMGQFLVDSIRLQDVNAVAGTTLFVAVLVLIAGILSDIANAALDPRVRSE